MPHPMPMPHPIPPPHPYPHPVPVHYHGPSYWSDWDNYYYHSHHEDNQVFQWIIGMINMAIPDAVVVGNDYGANSYYVCQAFYEGGVHPGKVYAGNCNIGYGGYEIVVPNYRILTGRGYHWVSAKFGQIPIRAVMGGHESNGQPLYVCRAFYHGEKHPGKIVGSNCNFGWGGREIEKPYYEALVY
jgi:hypothetical protein